MSGEILLAPEGPVLPCADCGRLKRVDTFARLGKITYLSILKDDHPIDIEKRVLCGECAEKWADQIESERIA